MKKNDPDTLRKAFEDARARSRASARTAAKKDTLMRIKKKSAWAKSKRTPLDLPQGSKWVLRPGDLEGPDNPSIPEWCEGVKGHRAERGIWHPWEYLGDDRVMWRRLIYPAREPTPMEELAEVGNELDNGGTEE